MSIKTQSRLSAPRSRHPLHRPARGRQNRLTQALGYEAIKQGRSVLYRSIFDLVRDFLRDEAFNQQDKTLRKYHKPDLVIIDDMGLKALPKSSGEYLLEVILRRYENRSTIMPSNRPLEDWGKLLNDVPTAGAILDRFLHHAIVISINGRSYRVKDATWPGKPVLYRVRVARNSPSRIHVLPSVSKASPSQRNESGAISVKVQRVGVPLGRVPI
jgi:hypothetical protein